MVMEMEEFEYKIDSSDILDKWMEKSLKKNNFIERWEKRIVEEATAMN